MQPDDRQDGGPWATRRNPLWAVLCTVGIAALSLWPRPPEPPQALWFPHMDKVVHFVMYTAYAAVLAWTFRGESRTWRAVIAIAAYGTAFGIAMELLQAAMPALDRSLSALDMAANAAGSLAGAMASRRTVPVSGRVRCRSPRNRCP